MIAVLVLPATPRVVADTRTAITGTRRRAGESVRRRSGCRPRRRRARWSTGRWRPPGGRARHARPGPRSGQRSAASFPARVLEITAGAERVPLPGRAERDPGDGRRVGRCVRRPPGNGVAHPGEQWQPVPCRLSRQNRRAATSSTGTTGGVPRTVTPCRASTSHTTGFSSKGRSPVRSSPSSANGPSRTASSGPASSPPRTIRRPWCVSGARRRAPRGRRARSARRARPGRRRRAGSRPAPPTPPRAARQGCPAGGVQGLGVRVEHPAGRVGECAHTSTDVCPLPGLPGQRGSAGVDLMDGQRKRATSELPRYSFTTCRPGTSS